MPLAIWRSRPKFRSRRRASCSRSSPGPGWWFRSAVTECSDETADSSCEYETNCGVRANWQRINLAVQNALSDITLADMAFPGAAELVLLARSSEEARQRRKAGPRSSDIH